MALKFDNNLGELAGAEVIGGVVAGPLGQKLSPPSFTHSVEAPTLAQEFSMRWRGADGKPSLLAYFSNFNTANAKGPAFGAAVGSITLSGGGVTSAFSFGNSPHK